MEINTDEYGKAVDNIAVLTEKTIKLKELEVKQMQLEMEKSRHDEELRIERMRAEAEIDKQQAETKSRKWDKWIDRGIKILEIGVPVVTVIWGTHYTFKYIVFVQTSVQIAKAYALPIALGTISITSILASHNIIRKRNAALASAYTLIDRSFKDYRGRVVDRFGEQVDRELRYDIKAVEVEKTAVNSKGKEVKVKDTEKVVDPNKLTDYARIFYSGNPGYDDDDPQYTLMHLRSIQNMMNDRLKAHGHVFLNEAYAALGFQPTKG